MYTPEKHLCSACGRSFYEKIPNIGNPIMKAKAMFKDNDIHRKVVQPNRSIEITQKDFPYGISIWGSNTALLWTSPKTEEYGIHIHAFKEQSLKPTIDEMEIVTMRKIIKDSRIQTLISTLIVFASYIVSTLQGFLEVVLSFVLLAFFFLAIVFVYYVAIIPVIELLKPKFSNSERVYSLERIKEYETTANIKEIWIISQNLELAYGQNGFSDVINTNIKRGVKYKFFINDNNIAKTRASEMQEPY